ncbi:putative non-LTR retroelement reverse transcriptase [Cucumis melo var. makuwa]|uniref:Non-LTR retroelement reverse transcriptase n=1 Tax=Cucumis melo var. makuwa TaxID=1194695 RepID=A0A5A7TVB8_CUCMM|nr:putative non-LTR retroelement reverse transcriptase [Cucumis melo var. makuwa]TYK14087.1 putative non-LTR retroelement reverse transcriptase [Cucumis melo var. makuwa]
MPTITILENDLICFQVRRAKSVEWILSRGPWNLGGKPMLLRKWTQGIVLESFVFTSVLVWIKLGRIPMELWTEAGLAVVASVVGKPLTLDLATKERRRLSYARVCVELDVDSHMPAEITVNLRGVDFIVLVNYKLKPRKCNLCWAFGHSSGKYPRSVESKVLQEEVVSKIIPGKRDELDSETCGGVVLESFKQLEDGEIRSSPNRPSSQVEKEVDKRDEFTLVTRKKRELVSIRDRGKSLEVTMPNSFGSLFKVGDVDKWALTIVEGSPPPSQVDEGVVALSGIKCKAVFDFLGSSSVGFCCLLETRVREIMWKKNLFSFSTRVVDEQFVAGTLTDLLSSVCVEGEMEDFDLAICDADLVEPSVQGNWFTWTSKHNRRVVSFRFFNHWVEYPSFLEVVSSMWGRYEGVSPLVSLMRNLQHLKSTLCRNFGRHIQSLSDEVHNANKVMDRAQREVKRNLMSDVLSRQSGLATEAFWTAVRLEEASLLNSDGSKVSSHDGVVQLAVNYFSNSLGSQEIGYRELSLVIDDIVQFRWSKECCQALQILADRLRVWLPSFISGNQSAFISGRSIIDNILLCQELVGGYHLYSGKPQCTLKVDLQKAYDSVNWDFLFGLLIAIGTPLKFVSWIRACITSPMFSIMINGSLERFFHGRKGHITSWIHSWTARVLSFAGKLQLVHSVLRSLQVYWASVFILPACVHNEVDKILRLKHHVRMEVGDGSRCRVWLDLWLQGGPILEQAVSPCLSVRDRWIWVPGRQGGFSIARGGVESRDHLFFSRPFGGMFGLGSFRSWLPLIGLGIGGLVVLDLSSGYLEGCEEEVVARSLVSNYLLYLERAESSSPWWLGL